MFSYLRHWMASNFDHPLLMFMYFVGLAFLAVGLILQFAVIPAYDYPPPIVAAFCGVYAIFFAAIGTIGYGVIYTLRAVSQARDRMGPAAG